MVNKPYSVLEALLARTTPFSRSRSASTTNRRSKLRARPNLTTRPVFSTFLFLNFPIFTPHVSLAPFSKIYLPFHRKRTPFKTSYRYKSRTGRSVFFPLRPRSNERILRTTTSSTDAITVSDESCAKS